MANFLWLVLALSFAAVGGQVAPPDGCSVEEPDKLGDGRCDDARSVHYNTALCGYDGGDCCIETCVSGAKDCLDDKKYCRDPAVLLNYQCSLRNPQQTFDGSHVTWYFDDDEDVVEKCCETCQRCHNGLCNEDVPPCLGFTVPNDDKQRCFPHFESFEDLGGDESLENQTCANGCGYYEVSWNGTLPNPFDDTNAPTTGETTFCNVENEEWVGDGICDEFDNRYTWYNSAQCGYDGGDCCTKTCGWRCDRDFEEMWCRDPEVLRSYQCSLRNPQQTFSSSKVDGKRIIWEFDDGDNVVEECCEKCRRCRTNSCSNDELPPCLGFTVPNDDEQRCFPHFESFEDLGGDESLEDQTCTNGCGYYEVVWNSSYTGPAPNTNPPVTEPPRNEASVFFNSHGSSIIVEFSRATNGMTLFSSPSSANCQALFQPQFLSLIGSAARCHFLSSSELSVSRLFDATVMPGDALMFIDEIALTFVEPVAEVPPEELVIESPGFPEAPVADLRAPRKVGPCASQQVQLSADLSTGFAGREALYDWTSSGCALNIETTTQNANLVVNMSHLEAPSECDFHLTVRNFLNVSSRPATRRVRRVSSDAPHVRVVRDSYGPWHRHKLRKVWCTIEFPDCDAEVAGHSGLRFRWRVSDKTNQTVDTEPVDLVDLGELREVSVRPFELQAGHSYQFEIQVSDPSDSFTPTNSSVDLTIEHAPLEAKISAPGSVFEHLRELPLKLDASATIDRDFLPTESVPDDHFEFQWTCSQGLTSEIDFANKDIELSRCKFSVPSGAAVELDANVTEVGRTYRFTVEVSTADGRTSHDEVFVNAVDTLSPVPQVSIIGPQQLSSAGPLRLEGVVDDVSFSGAFSWSELNYDVTSSSQLAQYLKTTLDGRNLVIEPGFLEMGLEYAFRLRVTAPTSGLMAEAIAHVQVVSGPVISQFEVAKIQNNASGTSRLLEVSASHSTYQLSVSAYVENEDEASDLTYTFGYFTDGVSDERLLTESQPISHVEVQLPPGDLTIVAHVHSSGFDSTETKNISVPQPTDAGGPCALIDGARESLEYALLNQLTSEAFQSAQILAHVLGVADYAECFGDVVAQRNDLFTALDTVWSFGSLHSVERVQQMALLVHSLTVDTSQLTLDNIESTLRWIDVIFEAVHVVTELGEPQRSLTFAVSISQILDNTLEALMSTDHELLVSDDGTTAYCDSLRRVQRHLNALLQLEVAEHLVGETAAVLDSGSIVARAIRASIQSDIGSIDLEDASFAISISSQSSSTSSSAGSKPPASVSFSSLGEGDRVAQCFQSTETGQAVVGSIVDISILECEQASGSDGCDYVVENVSFSLDYEEAHAPRDTCEGGYVRTESLQCSYWDETTASWRTDGCTTIALQKDGTVPSNSLQCDCTHLTTFALVKSYHTFLGDSCASRLQLPESLAGLFTGIYVVYAAIAIYQIYQVGRPFCISPNARVLGVHTLVSISSVSQALLIVSLHWLEEPRVVEVAAALQLAIHFAIFALIVQQWAHIYHGILPTNDRKRLRRAVKYAFVAASLLVGLLLSGILGAMALVDAESAAYATLSTVGSISISLIGVVTALVFVAYGALLIRMVTRVSREANRERKSENLTDSERAIRRVFKYMVLLTFVLMANASMAIVTVANPRLFEEHFTVMQSVHFGLDIFLMTAVLILYATLVKVARQRQDKDSVAPSWDNNNKMTTPQSPRGSGDGGDGSRKYSVWSTPEKRPTLSTASCRPSYMSRDMPSHIQTINSVSQHPEFSPRSTMHSPTPSVFSQFSEQPDLNSMPTHLKTPTALSQISPRTTWSSVPSQPPTAYSALPTTSRFSKPPRLYTTDSFLSPDTPTARGGKLLPPPSFASSPSASVVAAPDSEAPNSEATTVSDKSSTSSGSPSPNCV